MVGDTLEASCPVCRKKVSADVLLWSGDICYKLPGEFAVARCEICGLVISYPEMSGAELSAYYPSDYYGDVPKVREPENRQALERLAKKLYRQLKRGKQMNRAALTHAPSAFDLALPVEKESGKLLDVGAGWGRFLSGAMGMGWQVEGVDFSPEIHRVGEALGIPVYQGALEDVCAKLSGDYQMISMNHVLEHLDRPLETLEVARSLLSPGGVVRIQIPLWRPFFVRCFGKYWFPLDLPRHRWHFRIQDVRVLAKLAGFDRVMVLPETGTHPWQSSLRIWLRDHPKLSRWQRFASVDNRLLRALLFPMGWYLAAVRRPMEATFYLMSEGSNE